MQVSVYTDDPASSFLSRAFFLFLSKLPSCCASGDSLQGIDATSGSSLTAAAKRYGFSFVGLSSPDKAWEFGNNGVVNDSTPMPCSEADSKVREFVCDLVRMGDGRSSSFSLQDITYLKYVLKTLEALELVNENKVYTVGFSQNSMFAGYAAFCFPDNVLGTWQGGSGLALKGKVPTPPGQQVECTASSFAAHGNQCASTEP